MISGGEGDVLPLKLQQHFLRGSIASWQLRLGESKSVSLGPVN